jgi:hypothetical protein
VSSELKILVKSLTALVSTDIDAMKSDPLSLALIDKPATVALFVWAYGKIYNALGGMLLNFFHFLFSGTILVSEGGENSRLLPPTTPLLDHFVSYLIEFVKAKTSSRSKNSSRSRLASFGGSGDQAEASAIDEA